MMKSYDVYLSLHVSVGAEDEEEAIQNAIDVLEHHSIDNYIDEVDAVIDLDGGDFDYDY